MRNKELGGAKGVFKFIGQFYQTIWVGYLYQQALVIL